MKLTSHSVRLLILSTLLSSSSVFADDEWGRRFEICKVPLEKLPTVDMSRNEETRSVLVREYCSMTEQQFLSEFGAEVGVSKRSVLSFLNFSGEVNSKNFQTWRTQTCDKLNAENYRKYSDSYYASVLPSDAYNSFNNCIEKLATASENKAFRCYISRSNTHVLGGLTYAVKVTWRGPDEADVVGSSLSPNDGSVQAIDPSGKPVPHGSVLSKATKKISNGQMTLTVVRSSTTVPVTGWINVTQGKETSTCDFSIVPFGSETPTTKQKVLNGDSFSITFDKAVETLGPETSQCSRSGVITPLGSIQTGQTYSVRYDSKNRQTEFSGPSQDLGPESDNSGRCLTQKNTWIDGTLGTVGPEQYGIVIFGRQFFFQEDGKVIDVNKDQWSDNRAYVEVGSMKFVERTIGEDKAPTFFSRLRKKLNL